MSGFWLSEHKEVGTKHWLLQKALKTQNFEVLSQDD